VSYIVAYDSDLANVETLYATSLEMIDLVQTLNREIKARRVALILDTCYSGDAQRGGGGDRRAVARVWEGAAPASNATASSAFSAALRSFTFGRGRAVITASRADERSWEGRPFENGYFTHLLIEELRQDHGTRPFSDVLPAVRERVGQVMEHEHAGFTQTPTFEFGERAGSIALGTPEP
jgi:hypothetical protein